MSYEKNWNQQADTLKKLVAILSVANIYMSIVKRFHQWNSRDGPMTSVEQTNRPRVMDEIRVREYIHLLE